MDWNRDCTIIGPHLYFGYRWAGEFSSFDAAKAAVDIKRGDSNVDGSVLTEDDHELIAAIDADEA